MKYAFVECQRRQHSVRTLCRALRVSPGGDYAARPDGSAVSPAMPFATFKAMNETDLAAVYAYLHTLPPRAHGNR